MPHDYRKEEEEFLGELKARTGRDLAEWMAAIAERGFSNKNETIDWLRSQGFSFARASWLERIHTNGGRPIYIDAPGPKPARDLLPAAQEQPPQPATAPQAPTVADAALLEKLLAAAKGYRPLYHLLESELRKTLPGATFTARRTYISIGAPIEFAGVTLHPTEIRLGLDLGERAFDAQLQRARLKGPGPNITHMIVLTDARQVNVELMALISSANARVNG